MKWIFCPIMLAAFGVAQAVSITTHAAIANVHRANNDDDSQYNAEMMQVMPSNKDVTGVLICAAYRESIAKGYLYDGCDVGSWSNVKISINEYFNKYHPKTASEIVTIYFNPRDKEFLVYYK